MYGYIYNGTFDPFEPSRHLMRENDDECGNRQFGFRLFLPSKAAYSLVATTFRIKDTGAFTITVSGPSSVTLERGGKCTVRLSNSWFISEVRG